MSSPVRITGLAYDPWAHWEGREPSAWMGLLGDGRWVPLTQRRYQRADRGMNLREDAVPDPCERKDLGDQKSVEDEAVKLMEGRRPR